MTIKTKSTIDSVAPAPALRRWAVRRNSFTGSPTIYDAARGPNYDLAQVFGHGHRDSDEQAEVAAIMAQAPRISRERDRVQEINGTLLTALETLLGEYMNAPHDATFGQGLLSQDMAMRAIALAKGYAAPKLEESK